MDTDRKVFGERQNKIGGEIVNVVGEEKRWRKASYWPSEFTKKVDPTGKEEEEQSMVGQMPSSVDDSSEDGNENVTAGKS